MVSRVDDLSNTWSWKRIPRKGTKEPTFWEHTRTDGITLKKWRPRKEKRMRCFEGLAEDDQWRSIFNKECLQGNKRRITVDHSIQSLGEIENWNIRRSPQKDLSVENDPVTWGLRARSGKSSILADGAVWECEDEEWGQGESTYSWTLLTKQTKTPTREEKRCCSG